MRRLAASVLGVLAAVVAVAALVGAPARSADTYRVDAIFDTAKGVIPGQTVKIAGARVGTIQDVSLTKDYKARITMKVPRRFSFREDASCNIQPEGLISENFVQCDPGKPSKGELKGRGDAPPTVPVDRTSVPVNLTDLFRIFQADVRQRFSVAIAALGGGVAARGEDLNAILLRANPTLRAFRRFSRVLADQKQQLASAVDDTDTVIASLTRDRGDVQRFIDQTAEVTGHTANRRADLAESIRQLPTLLRSADSAIGNLNRLAVRGRPLLRQLRAASPSLQRLLPRIKPFAGTGVPALRELASFSKQAQPVFAHAQPLVSRLKDLSGPLPETARSLAATLVDLRDRGFVENLSLFAYYGAAAQARFDSTSHIFASNALVNLCSGYTTTAIPGCNAFYNQSSEPAPTADGGPAVGVVPRRAAAKAATPAARATATATPSATATAAPSAAPTAAPSAAPTAAAASGGGGAPGPGILDDLADFLLGA